MENMRAMPAEAAATIHNQKASRSMFRVLPFGPVVTSVMHERHTSRDGS
jgi:hypothetical protein